MAAAENLARGISAPCNHPVACRGSQAGKRKNPARKGETPEGGREFAKSEIRSTKSETNSKPESSRMTEAEALWFWSLLLCSYSYLFRVSDFVLRISGLDQAACPSARPGASA